MFRNIFRSSPEEHYNKKKPKKELRDLDLEYPDFKKEKTVFKKEDKLKNLEDIGYFRHDGSASVGENLPEEENTAISTEAAVGDLMEIEEKFKPQKKGMKRLRFFKSWTPKTTRQIEENKPPREIKNDGRKGLRGSEDIKGPKIATGNRFPKDNLKTENKNIKERRLSKETREKALHNPKAWEDKWDPMEFLEDTDLPRNRF